MFVHYLRSALRHFSKHKVITAINVLCLTFGFACFYVQHAAVDLMSRTDLYHEKSSRTFLLTQRREAAAGVSINMPTSAWALGPLIKTDFPSLTHVVRASRGIEVAVSSGDVKGFAMTSYADPDYLDVFDFDFVAGDSRRALQTPRSAVIYDGLALQLFGTTDVLGKPLLLNNRETVHVTGVMKEPRQPSYMSARVGSVALQQFQLLVSADASPQERPADGNAAAIRRTFLGDSFTFVVAPDPVAATLDNVRRDLGAFAKRHIPAEAGDITLDLRHGHEVATVASDFATRREQTGLSLTAITFAMGALVLLVACLNYANLASALATTRMKEIAMRRVVGARFREIALQAFLEASALVCVAALLAVALIPAISASLNTRMGTDIDVLLLTSGDFWLTMLVTLVFVAIMSSAYPALVAARVRPAQSLHSGRTPVFKMRALRLLVICQFALASFLFVASRVLDSYNDQLLATGPSPDEDPIVVISNDTQEIGLDRRLLQNALASKPAIEGVSAIDVAPGRLFGPSSVVAANAEAGATRKMLVTPTIDHGFFNALNIALLAGRDFDRGLASDLTTIDRLGNAIVDRQFVEERNWTPQEAVGKQIFIPISGAKDAISRPRTIVGVVDNQPLYPAKLGSAATLYSLDPTRVKALLVRIARNDVATGLRSIDETWTEFAPRVALKRQFIDQQFEQSYRQMNTMSDVSGYLSIFSLVIAALGLIGIATHSVTQRTHEIGVRKAVGATVGQIVRMLLKDFSKPILIGNVIAWPLAFGFAAMFKSFYVAEPPLTIMPYVGSLVFGLVVAWIAVIRKAWGAAHLPPAAVLRHE
jgi:putative ABC transport system permease protein